MTKYKVKLLVETGWVGCDYVEEVEIEAEGATEILDRMVQENINTIFTATQE